MGQRSPKPIRSNVIIEVTQFSVPTWQSVVVHEEETRHYAGEPVPDMGAEAHEAGQGGRMLAGTHHSKTTGMTHPFVISSPVGTKYLYPCNPTEGLAFPPAIGAPFVEYSFNSKLPSDLTVMYEWPQEEGLTYPSLVRTMDHRMFFVAPIRGGGNQIVELMQEGEGMLEGTMRAAVLYHVYGMLEEASWGDALSEVLPYLSDTAPLAHVRMQHIARWQFKSSRTRPLYA